MRQLTKRLKPGSDLREGIEELVKENSVKAGVLVSVVGNVKKAVLRMVGGKTEKTWDRPFEIVSGTGTLSVDGCHIHVALADSDGLVVGGHLKKGCIVKTTTEIVLLSLDDVEYKRILDHDTGYDELEVN